VGTWAPPAALRPCRATAASARESSLAAAVPAERRSDQCQARKLQERAILLALQRETAESPQSRQKGQDFPIPRAANCLSRPEPVKGA
jgi:hypothetical protein